MELRGDIDDPTAPSLTARLETLTTGPQPDPVLDLRATASSTAPASASPVRWTDPDEIVPESPILG